MLTRRQIGVFESSVEKLAGMLSSQYDIRVIFKHDFCMTDGKTIYLPVISPSADKRIFDVTMGYLDHEVAHVIFTDFDVIKKAKGKPALRNAINCLEDLRIEEEMRNLWRGSAPNIRECNEWCFEKLKEKWAKITGLGRVWQAALAYGTVGDGHWFIENVCKPDKETWEMVEKVKDIFAQASTFDSTKEVFANSIKVLKRLGLKTDEQDEEIKMSDTVFGIVSDVADLSEEEKDRITAGGQQNIIEYAEEDAEKDEQLTSRATMIQDACKLSKQDAKDYLIYTTEGDFIGQVETGDRQLTLQFLEQAREMTNVILRRMRLNLLSVNKSRWSGQKTRGKIDPKAVFRVGVGTSNRVFRKRIEAPSFNTRASLWIDHSGSMWGPKLELASKTALLFGEVLHELRIPFEVCGYSTVGGIGADRFYNAKPEDRRLFARWGDLWVGVYKEFDEDWRMARYRCITMVQNGQYNTYDGESVRLAATRLLRYPEKRKILFVMNDGWPFPNVAEKEPQHSAYCKRVAKEVGQHVELFAIGIQSEAVKDYYDKYVVVNQVDDIPKVVISKLDGMLRPKGGRYAIA